MTPLRQKMIRAMDLKNLSPHTRRSFLILEPLFEADFQTGSYGYRPKRTAHAAVYRVAEAVVKNKTRVIDLDLKAYFDNVRHDTHSRPWQFNA